MRRPTTTAVAEPGRIQFVEPMYARPVQNPPAGKDWINEVKFDGYRCLAGRDSAGVTLWSRRQNLFTAQFPDIARACERLPQGTLVDGEIVALDADGRISFNLLQQHRSEAKALLYYVFDVIFCSGRNLMNEPLEQRREVLAGLFSAGRAAPIALSEHIDAEPRDLIRVIREFGFEGIVAKRRDSFYESGKRSGAWVKYKVNRAQEFVIAGCTGRKPFDALIVGYYQDGLLLYAAKVRNGFVPQMRREVSDMIKGLETEDCPFANLPERKRTPWALTREEMKNCCWIRPVLVAQIEFTEWTPDGHLRHATFAGLRPDKDPKEVTREVPEDAL